MENLSHSASFPASATSLSAASSIQRAQKLNRTAHCGREHRILSYWITFWLIRLLQKSFFFALDLMAGRRKFFTSARENPACPVGREPIEPARGEKPLTAEDSFDRLRTGFKDAEGHGDTRTTRIEIWDFGIRDLGLPPQFDPLLQIAGEEKCARGASRAPLSSWLRTNGGGR